MKQLKFLIIALGLTIAQGVLAVTLPSTSYQPYNVATDYEAEGFSVGNIKSNMNFSALAEGGSWGDECAGAGSQEILACQNCCLEKFYTCCPGGACDDDEYNECKQLQRDCANDCGRSLPLDAPLWFMLLSVFILSVAKHLVVRMRQTRN